MIKYEDFPINIVNVPFFYNIAFMNALINHIIETVERGDFEYIPNNKKVQELKNYKCGFFIKRYNVHKVFLDSRITFIERKKGKCFNLENHPKSLVLRFKDKR